MAGTTALVTGGSRGLGRALVDVLFDDGAKVYGSVRTLDGAAANERHIPILLDVTDDASVAEVAARCGDVTLLINNAAAIGNSGLIGVDDLAAARLEMETNYWGMLRMCRAFAPILAANGGGRIVNILSIGALANIPFAGSYCASKAAALSLTQAARAELAPMGVKVSAVIAGAIATDMARESERDGRCPPDEMARTIVDAVGRGEDLIFPDAGSQAVAQRFAADPWALERDFGTRI